MGILRVSAGTLSGNHSGKRREIYVPRLADLWRTAAATDKLAGGSHSGVCAAARFPTRQATQFLAGRRFPAVGKGPTAADKTLTSRLASWMIVKTQFFSVRAPIQALEVYDG
jgi:hypothetical protein